MKSFLKSAYQALPMKQFFFKGLRKLKLPHCLYQHLHFTGVVTVKLPMGKSFKLHHDGFSDENELFWAGIANCWEKESFRLWMALCRRKSNPIIVDAGANNGIYSLVAQAVNDAARIYAFEPVPQINRRLRANLALNAFSVITENYAVSDQCGPVTLFVPPSDHSYSASLDPKFPSLTESAIPILIQAVSIDQYCQDKRIERLDILKIDIEGFEPQALMGMRVALTRFMPDILLEVLKDEAGIEIENIISGLGYLFYNIDEMNGPKLSKHIRKSSKYNYLLCQPETAAAIGLELPR